MSGDCANQNSAIDTFQSQYRSQWQTIGVQYRDQSIEKKKKETSGGCAIQNSATGGYHTTAPNDRPLVSNLGEGK